MHHTVPNILNFTSSLLMLLFVQPLSGNSLINCQALYNEQSYRLLIKILYSLLNGAMVTGSVRHNFQNLHYFRCPVWKIEKLIKSKNTLTLKHAKSILEYFEYFHQMLSKSILILLSYTISKSARFSETQCITVSAVPKSKICSRNCEKLLYISVTYLP